MVNDGSHILVYDRKYDELTDCTIDKIKDEPQLFLPLAGQEGFRREEESEVDIKATGKLAKVYDALIERNPEWLEGDKRHALNHFMTQIIFCLFAEDTGIFKVKDIFTKALKNRAGSDGELATQVITEIFSVLDLDEPHRKDISPWLTDFPYVNGGLFSGEVLVPEFTSKAYRYLLEAASLDWKYINPDILGSSIQAIVDPTMRGNLGMHYTSVPNILKTLEPLFLNELRDELLKARHSKKQINAFLERLSKIVVFDPACGSGNFLVIAYRELRKLELQALDALRDLEGGASLAFGFSSVISLSNFYGIEYADFAAETAKLALWIVEYQQNTRFRAAFGAEIPALPLKESGNIKCNNSLRVNWDNFCHKRKDSEVYVVSNPPYLGSRNMEAHHKADMKEIFSGATTKFNSFDYVCAWFYKAAKYCNSSSVKVAFVSTNSIAQGLHSSTFWPLLLKNGLEIFFCHQSFKWKNNAANNAGVICVVIGLAKDFKKKKTIYNDDGIHLVKNINAYLLDAPTIFIDAKASPISCLPEMVFGNMPRDGGGLILSVEEKEAILKSNPEAKKFIRRYVGSQEFIRNLYRYCIWVDDNDYLEADSIKPLRERFELVKISRENSPAPSTKKTAKYPYKFSQIQGVPEHSTIIVPRVTSENRDYLPVGYMDNREITSDLAFAIYDGPLWTVSLVSSRLHLLWIRTVCGKLKNDFRYSNTLGWNTFPAPKFSRDEIKKLDCLAKKILVTRETFFPKTIAELYDKRSMPNELRLVHEENDSLIESLYRSEEFISDEERLSYLFNMYIEMTKGSANE